MVEHGYLSWAGAGGHSRGRGGAAFSGLHFEQLRLLLHLSLGLGAEKLASWLLALGASVAALGARRPTRRRHRPLAEALACNQVTRSRRVGGGIVAGAGGVQTNKLLLLLLLVVDVRVRGRRLAGKRAHRRLAELVEGLERVGELGGCVGRQLALLESAPAPQKAAAVEHVQAARLQGPVGTCLCVVLARRGVS